MAVEAQEQWIARLEAEVKRQAEHIQFLESLVNLHVKDVNPKPHVNGYCWCGYTHNYPQVDLRVGDDVLDRSERAGTHGR